MPPTDLVSRALLRRLVPRVDEANAAIGAAIQQSRWTFAAVPAEFRTATLDATRAMLVHQLTLAADGAPWTPGDLDMVARQYDMSARLGIPIKIVDQSVRTSVSASLRTFWACAGDDATEDMLALTSWVHRNFESVRRTGAEAYCRRLAQDGDRATARTLLAEALICGRDPRPLAVPARFTLPPAFGVAVILPGGGRGDPGEPGILSLATPDGDVLLVSARGADPDERVRVGALVEAFVAGWIGPGAGARIGMAWAVGPAEVPRARQEATRVARLAGAAGRPGRVHHSGDVLVEAALARDPDGLDQLAAALDPLDRHPHLLTTLETFVAADFDRTRSAGALFLHRRTLQLRLSRIAELTGHSPTSARGILTLHAALSARRLRDVAEPVDPAAPR
ncbi:PucR family transcriptional regulator [Micromonospora sp. NPDC000089]|uniref:PucR family transcriptional regulator n=1 Tax=unclassified Micromonospora TaxID=2617518 RepID=UPI0036AA3B44